MIICPEICMHSKVFVYIHLHKFMTLCSPLTSPWHPSVRLLASTDFLFIYRKYLQIKTLGNFRLGLRIFKCSSWLSFLKAWLWLSSLLLSTLPKHILLFVTQNFLKGNSASVIRVLFKEDMKPRPIQRKEVVYDTML